MQPDAGPLSMYGHPAECDQLDWSWVDAALTAADVYWIVAAAQGRPPPARPVWGVWREPWIEVSIGSPRLRAAIAPGSAVTAHFGDALDVVIVEGVVTGTTDDPAAITAYDDKYDWDYDVERYGALTVVRADKVMAWRSAGPAGRDGFVAAGRWRFGR